MFFDFNMVEEHRLKKIGDSKFLLIPYEFVRVYDLDKYVYLCEVKEDGKQIIFSRMRPDENVIKK